MAEKSYMKQAAKKQLLNAQKVDGAIISSTYTGIEQC